MQTYPYGASQYFAQCMGRIALPARARVVDMPCGFGRHAHYLAASGLDVLGIDSDSRRVDLAAKRAAELGLTVSWLVADIEKPLPIQEAGYDLAVIVHYASPRILRQAIRCLKPGGYLIFETFGGHGQNWQALPALGRMRRVFANRFDLIHFEEHAVGPTKSSAVIKALGRRRQSQTSP